MNSSESESFVDRTPVGQDVWIVRHLSTRTRQRQRSLSAWCSVYHFQLGSRGRSVPIGPLNMSYHCTN